MMDNQQLTENLTCVEKNIDMLIKRIQIYQSALIEIKTWAEVGAAEPKRSPNLRNILDHIRGVTSKLSL